MDHTLPKRFTRLWQRFQFALRNDSATREQLRILVLAIAICLGLYYLAYSVFIEPKKRDLKKLTAKATQIAATAGSLQLTALGPKIVQLEHKKEVILENIAILNLRKSFHLEQLRSLGDVTRFNSITFSLPPAAPFPVNHKLLHMNLGAKKSFALHEEEPLTIAGKGAYRDVIAYLHSLEISPEIGAINDLTMKSLSEKEHGDDSSVNFSLQVARIILKDQ